MHDRLWHQTTAWQPDPAADTRIVRRGWEGNSYPLAESQKELELYAEELRMAQRALNEITGEFDADDLLGKIFSRFCIGK